MKTVHFTSSSPSYQDSLKIRKEVFIHEQEIDPALEIDEFEDECTYFLTTIENVPAATGRLRVAGKKIKFERIASLRGFRGKGAATHLMRAMEAFSKTQHRELKPFMHAQLDAVSFYEKIGWIRVGDVFLEAGISHVAMTKEL